MAAGSTVLAKVLAACAARSAGEAKVRVGRATSVPARRVPTRGTLDHLDGRSPPLLIRVAPLGRRVDVVVNYDHSAILPDVLDAYSEMVRGLVDQHYASVARYTTSGFLRMKLGDALKRRGVAPHIVESAVQARTAVVGRG